MAALTADGFRRLALVRHLYRQALHQGTQPQPLKATALLSLHDAVELFLGLACESLGRTVKPRTGFPEYWELLKNGEPPIHLSHETAMLRLNTARVSLKHHGILPDGTAVEELTHATGECLADNTTILWNVQFASISIVHFVSDPDIRKLLEAAEAKLAVGTPCTHEMSLAFATLLGRSMKHISVGSLFDLTSARQSHPFDIADRDVARYLAALDADINNIRRSLLVVAMRLDFERFCQFELNSYPASISADGTISVNSLPLGLGVAECRRGVDFVVDSVLRVQAGH
jgi:hypothetical protein